MRVISRKRLIELSTTHPDAKPGLDAWFHEAESADWANPAQVKEQYATASILKNGRVVFNIAGNKYPLDRQIKLRIPRGLRSIRGDAQRIRPN